MTGLLDLPDEVLIEILAYFKPRWLCWDSKKAKAQRKVLLRLNKRIASIALAELQYLGRDLSWYPPSHPVHSHAYDEQLASLIEALRGIVSVSISSSKQYGPTWDPNVLPASSASLRQHHPMISCLRLLFSSFNMAIAILSHLPNLEDIIFMKHSRQAKDDTLAIETKRREFWSVLCGLTKLRKLLWQGSDIMASWDRHAGFEPCNSITSKTQVSLSLRTLDYSDVEAIGNGYARDYMQVSARAYPHITHLNIDAHHLADIVDQHCFPKLVHLEMWDHDDTFSLSRLRDTPAILDALGTAEPQKTLARHPLSQHKGLSRLRVARARAAYLFLKDDRCFPALRFLTVNADTRKKSLCNRPLLCTRIKMPCARRGVRLFEEVWISSNDEQHSYVTEEIDCSGEASGNAVP